MEDIVLCWELYIVNKCVLSTLDRSHAWVICTALGCTCAVGPIASTDVSQIECIAANPKKGVSI
jgi:hypothetical protein